jgi:hypothetical protein
MEYLPLDWLTEELTCSERSAQRAVEESGAAGASHHPCLFYTILHSTMKTRYAPKVHLGLKLKRGGAWFFGW